MKILRPKVINSAILRASRFVPDTRGVDEIMASVLALRSTFQSHTVSQHSRSAKTPFLHSLEQQPAPHQPAIGWFTKILVEAWAKIRVPVAPETQTQPHETLPRISEKRRQIHAESLDTAADYLRDRLHEYVSGCVQTQIGTQSGAYTDTFRKDTRRLAELFLINRLFSSELLLANQTKQCAIEKAYTSWKKEAQRFNANPLLENLWKEGILETWNHASGVILNIERLEMCFKEAQGGESIFSTSQHIDLEKLREAESHYKALIEHISPKFDSLIHKIYFAQSTFAAKTSLHYSTLKFDIAPTDRSLFERYLGDIHQRLHVCP